MALNIVWTPEPKSGFESIVEYLEYHFTDKEVQIFVKKTSNFLLSLREYPTLLKSTDEFIGVRRGPINKFTILTYKIDYKKEEIILLSVRSARQRPQ